MGRIDEERKGGTHGGPRAGIGLLLVMLFGMGIAQAGTFSIAPWTSDLDCGVSAQFTYTCALNMEGSTYVVNGVTFTGAPNLNPSGSGYAVSGFTGEYSPDDANNVASRSRELAKRFHYNGNPAVITLSGLTPGTVYKASFFSVGWDASPDERNITFSCGTDSLLVNQNTYGNNNGIRIDYDYVAGAGGSVTIYAARDVPNNRTFHIYAFCNREARTDLYVDNGSFEWPVITGNGGVWESQDYIPGWTQSGGGNIGLSQNATPWAGNGAFPDGVQVVYIQNYTTTETIGQRFVNLTAGETYRVSYRYAGRDDGAGRSDPRILVTLDGQTLQDTYYPKNVGSGNPFFLGAYAFTATGATANITFADTRSGFDTAVLLDDVRLEADGVSGWTLGHWTNDASAGLDSSAHYTHAIDLGDISSPTIDGVAFKGSGAGGYPTEGAGGANYVTALSGRYGGPDGNNLASGSDGSATMAKQFCYQGSPPPGQLVGFTLNGLIPGQTYVTTFYGIGFDGEAATPSARTLAFSVNGSPEVTFNENVHGNDNGVRLSYRGTADASGSIRVVGRVYVNNYSFHFYGFANKAEPDADLVLADAFAGHNGADNGSYINTRAPDHANQFLSGNYTETGMNTAYHTDIQNGTARVGANAGAAIKIHNADYHIKPGVMRIQAALKVGNLTYTGADYNNARGVGLGFYRYGLYTDNSEVATGFTGLVIAPNGDLYLMRNGAYAGDGYRVAFGGTFDPNTFYTLSYEVNVTSSTIDNITLDGSSADYSVIEGANGFGELYTDMAGFLGSSSTGGKYGYVDTFMLTELTPGTATAGSVFFFK